MNRPVVLALLTVAAIAGLAAAVRIAMPGGPPAPDFTLTDQDGRPYSLSAHRGHAVALFFGYAHCPDVCPTTLAALARAKRRLGTQGNDFDVAFVTVDPQRDTPAVLKRYVRLFDPSFAGLTGTEAQLEPVYRDYHVFHQQIPGTNATGYLIEHSSAIEFIGPAGTLRGTGDWNDSPDELFGDIKRALL